MSCGQGEPHSGARNAPRRRDSKAKRAAHGLFMSHLRQPLMSNRAPPFPRLIQPCRSGWPARCCPRTGHFRPPIAAHPAFTAAPRSGGILDEPRMPKPRPRSLDAHFFFFFSSLREAQPDPGRARRRPYISELTTPSETGARGENALERGTPNRGRRSCTNFDLRAVPGRGGFSGTRYNMGRAPTTKKTVASL